MSKRDGCMVCGCAADPENFCSGCWTSYRRLLKRIEWKRSIDQIDAAILWAASRLRRRTPTGEKGAGG
jgi:hypothetical protein